MKSGTQLLIVRSSGAKLKIAIPGYKRRRFYHYSSSSPLCLHTRDRFNRKWTKTRLLPTIPMLLFPGPRSWLQDGCSSVSSQKNRDERASRSWGTNARTEAIPWLYISQRRPRKRGGGDKKKYRENQTSTSPSASSFFNTSLQKQKRQNKKNTKTRGGRTQKKTRGRLEKQTRQKQREALASQRTSTSLVSGCTAPWTDGRRAGERA
jgi:hypothetical protein